MIKSNFILDFVKRGGFSVLFSTVLIKLSAIVLSIVVVKLLSKEDYGILSYILSIYAIVIVVAGFGGNYALLRFGSITESLIIRKTYYDYTQYNGLKYTLLVALLVVLYSFFIPQGMKSAQPIIILMSIGLFTFYALETMRSYFRIINLNRLYSKINVYNSLILVVSTVILTYLLQVYGYIIAIIITPLITFILFRSKIPRIDCKYDIQISKKEYWGYGIHTSISAIANQIIFSIAPLLLAILNEPQSAIANFRVATIIPLNLLTLPGILMISDFNFLSRNYKNVKSLKKYYISYLKVVIPISLVVFLLLSIYADTVIELLFGKQYLNCKHTYQIFMIATFITYIFRNPLGNILLAVGKAKWNGYNTYVFCGLYILFSLVFYQYWGIWAIVYGLCGTFILSGFVSLALFIFYIRQLK